MTQEVVGSSPIIRPIFMAVDCPTFPSECIGFENLRKAFVERPPQRILAVCREHVGDIVNTTGALLDLRRCFPDSFIAAEIGERAVGVLQNFPGLDRIVLRPTRQGLMGKIGHLLGMRRERYDLAVIFDDTNDHVLHAWLAGISLRAGIWRGVKYRQFFSAYVPYVIDKHELRDHCRLLLEALGCPPPYSPPRLFVSKQDRLEAEKLLSSNEQMVGVHPGASEPKRRWPASYFARLLDLLGPRGVLLGGASDKSVVQEIVGLCQRPPATIGKDMSILQFAAVCESLQVLVCGDTGPMHIAATMGTPVVALYGPAYPSHTGPIGEGHRILQAACSCPKRVPDVCQGTCMADISVEQVYGALDSMGVLS